MISESNVVYLPTQVVSISSRRPRSSGERDSIRQAPTLRSQRRSGTGRMPRLRPSNDDRAGIFMGRSCPVAVADSPDRHTHFSFERSIDEDSPCRIFLERFASDLHCVVIEILFVVVNLGSDLGPVDQVAGGALDDVNGRGPFE